MANIKITVKDRATQENATQARPCDKSSAPPCKGSRAVPTTPSRATSGLVPLSER